MDSKVRAVVARLQYVLCEPQRLVVEGTGLLTVMLIRAGLEGRMLSSWYNCPAVVALRVLVETPFLCYGFRNVFDKPGARSSGLKVLVESGLGIDEETFNLDAEGETVVMLR